MSYYLQAIIGSTDLLASQESHLRSPIELSTDVYMLPLTTELREALAIPELPFDRDDLTTLPAPLDALCRRLSKRAMIAYIEAAYWGGDGIQASVLYEAGTLVGSTRVSNKGAINFALRAFGVKSTGQHDEFAVVGLGRHRSTDAWRSG